jgi:hypothetical protein
MLAIPTEKIPRKNADIIRNRHPIVVNSRPESPDISNAIAMSTTGTRYRFKRNAYLEKEGGLLQMSKISSGKVKRWS